MWTTTELEAAVDGADFVTTAMEVDRYLYWSQDFHVPRKHGFRQVFGENGGPGGLFHALRNFTPMLVIARAMERHCTNALLLNFTNPEVLLRVIETLLLYVRHGADIIRLDAVTYLWAAPGTPCANLAQSHEIVKLFRTILDCVAPAVTLITETNVPHSENIAYFGDGHDEAHMVYNFALPPLVLHAFYTGDATALSRWARDLCPPSTETTFFNFLDSHDGIGLLGARGILTDDEIDAMVQKTQQHGGLVSFRTASEGGKSPYELNITWFDALNDPKSGESSELQVRRFIASRSIAFILAGVPAVYVQSLTGSQLVDAVDPAELDEPRGINRRASNPEKAVAPVS